MRWRGGLKGIPVNNQIRALAAGNSIARIASNLIGGKLDSSMSIRGHLPHGGRHPQSQQSIA
jgi:hypothetical protein